MVIVVNDMTWWLDTPEQVADLIELAKISKNNKELDPNYPQIEVTVK